MEHAFREGTFQFVEIDAGVAALPGCKQLKVRPIVLRKHLSVLLFELAQLLGPFRIRFEIRGAGFAHFLRYIDFVADGTVLYVLDIFVIPVVNIFLHFDHSGRIGSDDQSGVALYAHTHNDIVAGGIVLDVEDFGRGDIEFLHEARAVLLGEAGNGAVDGAVRGVALDLLAHDGYDVALIHFWPVFDEVEEPYLVHLAVDVLEIGFGNRYPFRLSGRTGSGCIKHRFALEQDIRFSVLHSGYIRSEVFVIRCLYLLLISGKKFSGSFCFKYVRKIVLFSIDCVLSVIQDGSEAFFL